MIHILGSKDNHITFGNLFELFLKLSTYVYKCKWRQVFLHESCSIVRWSLQRREWHHLFTELPFNLSRICVLCVHDNSTLWHRVHWICWFWYFNFVWLCDCLWRRDIRKTDWKVKRSVLNSYIWNSLSLSPLSLYIHA